MAVSAYQYVDETGLIVPDTQEIKTQVEDEYLATFGADLVISDDTVQGVLIVAETTARDEVVRNNAAVANQINPNEAGGVYLDSVMALTGSKRVEDTFSITTCNLTGQPGTVIPETTSTAKNMNGDIFAAVDTVTLDVDGLATVNFQSIVPGPISAQMGTLTNIYQGVLGWETITNTNNATLGSLKQSDGEARQYRRQTLALQGESLPVAITSALYATPGVKTLSFRENITSEILVIDGVSMKPHSMFVCVDGGTDEDVANVLLEKKSGGCDYTNSEGTPVTVDVIEPASGQTYPVSFSRPDLISYDAIVYITSNSSIIGDPTTIVKQAILAYTNGLIPGETGLSVGISVSSFELAGAINIAAPGIFVSNVRTRYNGSGDPFTSDLLLIEIYEKATTELTNIVVTIV